MSVLAVCVECYSGVLIVQIMMLTQSITDSNLFKHQSVPTITSLLCLFDKKGPLPCLWASIHDVHWILFTKELFCQETTEAGNLSLAL